MLLGDGSSCRWRSASWGYLGFFSRWKAGNMTISKARPGALLRMMSRLMSDGPT